MTASCMILSTKTNGSNQNVRPWTYFLALRARKGKNTQWFPVSMDEATVRATYEI